MKQRILVFLQELMELLMQYHECLGRYKVDETLQYRWIICRKMMGSLDSIFKKSLFLYFKITSLNVVFFDD